MGCVACRSARLDERRPKSISGFGLPEPLRRQPCDGSGLTSCEPPRPILGRLSTHADADAVHAPPLSDLNYFPEPLLGRQHKYHTPPLGKRVVAGVEPASSCECRANAAICEDFRPG